MRQRGKYNRAGQVTGDNVIWRTRIACLIIKATDTHLEYVTLIAFPLQQWLHESASILRNAFAACVVDTLILLCLEHT